jgi:hypothetical protein
MLTSKRVEGEVNYNDGSFAEVETYGIEGIEKNLLLETVQLHIEDTEDTPEQFQQRFPVGTTLSILTITEVTVLSGTEQCPQVAPVHPIESTPVNSLDKADRPIDLH